MTSNNSISKAIENLSTKRHVVSEEALAAKRNRDEMLTSDPIHQRKLSIVDEFNDSVKILTAVFRESHFDDLALFVSNPGRVLIINFFIGLFRGLGVALGMIIVFALLIVAFSDVFPPDALARIGALIRSFLDH